MNPIEPESLILLLQHAAWSKAERCSARERGHNALMATQPNARAALVLFPVDGPGVSYSMTYPMRYSVRYLLKHSENCGVTTISRVEFCLERGLAVHSFIYYISPMLAVGLKLKSGCMIAYASMHESSNQFALGFPTLLVCSIRGAPKPTNLKPSKRQTAKPEIPSTPKS